MEHLAAQLRIGGVHRNVDRRQLKINDTLDVMLFHVGQRHIVSLKEGKTGIIVLKIKGFAHARRHLVNETENAFVAAGLVIAHKSVLKGDAKILVLIFYFQLPLLAVCLFHQHDHAFAVYIIFIIKDIFHFISIDRK